MGMKKFFIFLLLAIIFLSGCGAWVERNRQAEELRLIAYEEWRWNEEQLLAASEDILLHHNEIHRTLDTLTRENNALHHTLETLIRENDEMREALLQFENSENPASRFQHGLTEELVRENFFEFLHGDEMQELLINTIGREIIVCETEDWRNEITVLQNYLMLKRSEMFPLMLLFRYDVRHETGETWWTYLGYHVALMSDSFTPAGELPQPRRLTERREVTVQFCVRYRDMLGFTSDIDYIEETIRGEDLWSEAIRLAYDRIGVTVRDLWYDGRTLYVDLPLDMNWSMRIGFGSTVWAQSMINTFYTFPDVDEVIFLFNGKNYPHIYVGFRINEPRGLFWDY